MVMGMMGPMSMGMMGPPMGYMGMMGPPMGPRRSGRGASQADQEQELERIIRSFALDELANEALHRIPLRTAREILHSLDGGVRNPSAFVMSKIRSMESGGAFHGGMRGGGAGLPPMPDRMPRQARGGGGIVSDEELFHRAKIMLDKYRADERARQAASDVPPDVLFDIFSQLDNSPDIRNPSAFIFQACMDYRRQAMDQEATRVILVMRPSRADLEPHRKMLRSSSLDLSLMHQQLMR